jgi:MFS family permease
MDASMDAAASPSESAAPAPARGLALRFGGALRHRSYRLFFAGQSVSLAGTWLTRFATVWMVYRLTRSPVMLGLVGFCGQAPAAVLAPIAGVLVDRWDRRRTVIATQIASMLQSAALAFFALTGWMTVWHLLALGAVQAVINAFDTVARQSFLGEMIEDRADLPNAVALNSLMVNTAKMLGPVAAAAIVGLVGEGWCFTIDAASSLAVIASLFAMRVRPRAVPPREGHVSREMREGLAYVAQLPAVRAALLLFASVSLLAGSYSTLLPLYTGGTLHGGPHTLGTLMGAAGLGALTGAVILARHTRRGARGEAAGDGGPAARARALGFGRLLAVCAMGLGAGFALLEVARSTLVAAPILFVVGACLMVQSAGTFTIVQTLVDDPDKLGRVMSLVALAFYGGAPLGALLEGQLAKLVGPVHTFAIAGACLLASGLAFTRALSRLRAAPGPA